VIHTVQETTEHARTEKPHSFHCTRNLITVSLNKNLPTSMLC